MSAGASAWRDYRRIWTAAVTWRNPAAVEWGGRIALLLALAAGMAQLAGVLKHGLLWRMELFIAGSWFAMLWITLFLPASVLMNSAPNARLVPRLRRRLVQLAGASWLFLALGLALLFDWRAFPVFGFYVLGFMLSRAGMRSGIVLILSGSFWPFLYARLPPGLAHALATPAALALASVLALACAGWTLARLYPAGGDRHLDRRARIVATIYRYEQRYDTSPADLPAPFLSAYARSLRRACRLRRPQAMLMHALGVGAHWSVWLLSVGLVLAVGMGVRLYSIVSGNGAAQGMSDWLTSGGSSTTTFMVMFSTAQYAQQLRRTRGEQALLRLTPLAGDAALMNRRLAGGMLKGALAVWCMLAGAILAATWLLGGESGLARQFALRCLGGQVAMTNLLGDYARAVPASIWWRYLPALLQAGCVAALALGLSRLGGDVWIWLTVISIAGWIGVVALKWRRMLAAPPAYPVERFD